MFLASRSHSDRSAYCWSSLIRPGMAVIIVFSLLLDPLTIPERLVTIVIGGLFLGWGFLVALAGRFWQRSTRLSGALAFVDLAFASAMVVFCHGLSLVWLPVLFLLPALELSSLYGAGGIAFVLIAFIWTTILSGLMNLMLFQQPLWWIIALLWGTFILFTATMQAMHLGYLHPAMLRPHLPTMPLVKIEELAEVLPRDEQELLPPAHLTAMLPQLASAFELPFRRMGVCTEDHRQDIEAALAALYSCDGNQEALSLCLERLLQAAWQNWMGLAAFSPREQEILELLLQNYTYKEMSSRLHVSPSTIKTHIYHIFQKLDVSTRDEAMRLIHKRGWFARSSSLPLLLEVSPR